MPYVIDRATVAQSSVHAIVGHLRRPHPHPPLAFTFYSLTTATSETRCLQCMSPADYRAVEALLPMYRGWLRPKVPAAA